jgi:hypothetical protein
MERAMSRTTKLTALMCWIMPIRLPVSFSGSIINSADLEHAGYAEVDGFYRFPSFELCEGERCQQGYSAFNVKRRHPPQEHCHVHKLRNQHPPAIP